MDDAPVTVELNGDGVARLRGELDLSSYDDVSSALTPLFDADGDVVLDLAELTFVDSSGIRIFIRLHTALQERGGSPDHSADRRRTSPGCSPSPGSRRWGS